MSFAKGLPLYNKLDRGSYRDAYYQIPKFYPFQFEKRRILDLVFFGPMFQLVNPWDSKFWPQGHHMHKLARGSQGETIYQISKL